MRSKMSTVIGIYIAESANAAMKFLSTAALEAGKGIVGDRYYNARGTFSEKLADLPDFEVTLIESERIESFNKEHGFDYNHGDLRRNIVTQGIDLNTLEGKEFTVGDIRLRGVRLCEPCAHLAKVLTPKVIPALVHKAGLRAQILAGGALRIGDAVVASTR
jgi:hypothetical protein